MKKTALLVALFVGIGSTMFAQDQAAPSQSVVNININVSKTVQAVSYPNNTSSRMDFTGTPLLPSPRGRQRLTTKKASSPSTCNYRRCRRPRNLGPEFLTYVLWAITPEGRAANLGEILLNGDKAKLLATTQMPNFALIITAEPYFAVTEPSEAVVLMDVPGSNTKGMTTPVSARLLKRSAYHQSQLQPITMNSKTPLAVYEARNAMRIAQLQGAEKYAPNAWSTAQQSQAQMDDYIARKQKNPTLTAARSTTQQAEDARSLAVKALAAEKVAQAKQAEAEQAAQAKQREAQLTADQQLRKHCRARRRKLALLRKRRLARRPMPPGRRPMPQLKSLRNRRNRQLKPSDNCEPSFSSS